MYKIVRCVGYTREVVDGSDTMEEARRMRQEYEISDSSAKYLIRFPPRSEQHRVNEWHREAARYDT